MRWTVFFGLVVIGATAALATSVNAGSLYDLPDNATPKTDARSAASAEEPTADRGPGKGFGSLATPDSGGATLDTRPSATAFGPADGSDGRNAIGFASSPIPAAPLAAEEEADPTLIGDMNGDGLVNNLDINPFVMGLTDGEAYQAAFSQSPTGPGDVNLDGEFNNLDINPFVSRLTSGEPVRSVPTPGSMAMGGLVTAVMLGEWARRRLRDRRRHG